jgi:DNA-binding response OmpR family regulator
MSILILIAEDEGYLVRVAHDGIAALELGLREGPDLILSDVQLPRLDGLELIGRLRDGGSIAPAVLMSARRYDPEASGELFLSKPFDLDQLMTIVHEALTTDASNSTSQLPLQ